MLSNLYTTHHCLTVLLQKCELPLHNLAWLYSFLLERFNSHFVPTDKKQDGAIENRNKGKSPVSFFSLYPKIPTMYYIHPKEGSM